MSALSNMIWRDVRQSYASGGTWLPVIFYLSAATLFPFAVGPDRELLLETGGGILWIAALLATLLPLDRLVQPDLDNGLHDQLIVRGITDELIAFGRLISHWLAFGPPLLFAAFLASGLMGLEGPPLVTLLVSLAIATPALAGLAVMIAALTSGLKGAGALGGLLLVPLAIPLLIFGAGSLSDQSGSALLFLGAVSLLLVAVTPFAAGAALKAARE
ncbi:heme exporter protein B [Parasphingorhabdus marina DSM 22363]|uniref:Heme exporter protein B n=1 Tax=Parasphingorhabdus marina DSM 22363 TaxID=1123272 RepID=A0A1N6CSX0_9SPHN|nr:heme exporter protein CcmB [Parasphingorhabdus marina]SIN61585.1 heme exporter protein B [Parasphingorhabdus marina DSM 22363]